VGERPDRADPPASGTCPICGTPVGPDARYAPFCRERCKMVDLGRWFRGEYVVAGEDAIEMDPEAFAEGIRDLRRREAEEADNDEGGEAEPEA